MQQTNTGGIQTGNIEGQTVVVGHQNHSHVHYHHFPDWNKLQDERKKLLAQYQQHPTVTYFVEELQQIDQQLESFQREVLKLAEDFQQIPLNTERLREAKAAFDRGDIQAVRVLLREPEVVQEAQALLQKREHLATQTADNEAHLKDKANEFLLLVRATALDFELKEQRIPKTCAAFEQALECDRAPDHLFAYALFLQDENQRTEALAFYEEVLTQYRALAVQQQALYQPYVASTLNNLAILLSADPAQRGVAQGSWEESLRLHRALAAQQLAVYQADVAMTLNNLAALLRADPAQRGVAQSYFEEALAIRRALAAQQPSVYQADVAQTLGAQGVAYLQWQEPQTVLPLLTEALSLYQSLYELHPTFYGQHYKFTQTLLNGCREWVDTGSPPAKWLGNSE